MHEAKSQLAVAGLGLIGMSLAITLMGFAGGLVMSAIKRDRGVKDYGTLIEGHGGVMDRIDSICFAAPVFFHCGSGNRVGGALIPYFMLDKGMAEDDAVALADAIAELLQDRELGQALGRAARDTVTASFDNDRNLQLVLQLLETRHVTAASCAVA